MVVAVLFHGDRYYYGGCDQLYRLNAFCLSILSAFIAVSQCCLMKKILSNFFFGSAEYFLHKLGERLPFFSRPLRHFITLQQIYSFKLFFLFFFKHPKLGNMFILRDNFFFLIHYFEKKILK